MKSAFELKKSKQEKLDQKQKENTERINVEMLELEKAFNKWESDLNDTNNYITVPLIIRTNEVKSLLDEKGYIIDKISNDIEVNTTRIYLDKTSYDIATGNTENKTITINMNDNLKQFKKEYESKFRQNKKKEIKNIKDDEKEIVTLDKILENIAKLNNCKIIYR